LPAVIEDTANDMQILPTITTITPGKWRDKVKEVRRFKLKEIAVFPTCLNQEERKELFSLLEKTSVKRIPLVHLRNDMTIAEMDYLVKKFKTKVFNTHTSSEYPFLQDYSKYRDVIYIEDVYTPFDEEELKQFAGVCVDFSHLENDRLLNQEKYQHDIAVIERHRIGCGHISAIKDKIVRDEKNYPRYSAHFLENLQEFDYLKRYPLKYFGEFLAIELENSIEEQLKVKEYLSTLIKNK